MKKVLVYFLAVSFTLFSSFPLLWMFVCSLKPYNEIYSLPVTILPKSISLENYETLFRDIPFSTFVVNSFIIAGCTTLICIGLASLGAYGLTRFKFPGRDLIARLTLVTYMVSPVTLVIPLYLLLVVPLHLADTHLGLVMVYVTISLPLCLWLVRAFFLGVPMELDEAAMVDGATRLQALVYIVLPQAVPGIIAASIISLTWCLDEYLYALIIIDTVSNKTYPIGIGSLAILSFELRWDYLLSAGVIITAILLIVFAFAQRWLIKGWGAGAVKG